jgi:hypothetical protein
LEVRKPAGLGRRKRDSIFEDNKNEHYRKRRENLVA